jgi:hypothetical protein
MLPSPTTGRAFVLWEGSPYTADVSRGTTTMNLRPKIVSLLSRPGERLCVGCIARMLEARPKQAHEATLKLEAQSGFQRGYAICAKCGKTRIVTNVRAPASVPNADC